MSHISLIPPASGLESLIARANTFISRARAASTVRAYRSDFADFVRWSKIHGPQVPASITRNNRPLHYRSRLEAARGCDHRPPSDRHLKAHAAAGFSSPASTRNLVVGDTLRGIKRTLGTAPHRKDALLSADIRRLIKACPKNLLGTRDEALFLVSFAGAFRRSESVGLNVEDLKSCREGLVCTLRRSKTDQEGVGRKVGIPFGKNKTDVPRLRTEALAQKRKDQIRPGLPRRQPSWPSVSPRSRAQLSRGHHQAGCPPCGDACRESERSQFAGWSCEPGGQEGSAGVRDHEADGAQVEGSFGGIYKDGRNVHAERGVGPGHLSLVRPGILTPDKTMFPGVRRGQGQRRGWHIAQVLARSEYFPRKATERQRVSGHWPTSRDQSALDDCIGGDNRPISRIMFGKKLYFLSVVFFFRRRGPLPAVILAGRSQRRNPCEYDPLCRSFRCAGQACHRLGRRLRQDHLTPLSSL